MAARACWWFACLLLFTGGSSSGGVTAFSPVHRQQQHQKHHYNAVPRNGVSTSLSAKKILVCFDGSGNSPETNFPNPVNNTDFTNVLRFHLLAGGSIDRTDTSCYVDGQVSLYARGVGAQWWQNIVPFWKDQRGAFRTALAKVSFYAGRVELEQINPTYERLTKIYKEGDKLYIIGFSRGSASARLFTSKICNEGIGSVKNPSIEFLGCFDTVLQDQFKNLNQFERNSAGFAPATELGEVEDLVSTNVKKAVHCVSLDDTRFTVGTNGLADLGTFAPTLMSGASSDVVTEVWFPGSHSNVGGGYYYRGLSDGAFAYMKEWLETLEDPISFLEPDQVSDKAFKNSLWGFEKEFADNTDKLRQSLVTNPNPLGEINLGDGWGCFRSVDCLKKGGKSNVLQPLLIHKSVSERLQAMSNRYLVNPRLQMLQSKRPQVITHLDKISPTQTAELHQGIYKSTMEDE